uniref:Uncharacterized protein n=1 Tax=Rhizophora mucronata TaxID=61149 RepID=A0A2P2QIJ8_RHIMU
MLGQNWKKIFQINTKKMETKANSNKMSTGQMHI